MVIVRQLYFEEDCESETAEPHEDEDYWEEVYCTAERTGIDYHYSFLDSEVSDEEVVVCHKVVLSCGERLFDSPPKFVFCECSGVLHPDHEVIVGGVGPLGALAVGWLLELAVDVREEAALIDGYLFSSLAEQFVGIVE